MIAVFMWMFVVPYLEALKLQKEPRMVTEMEFRFGNRRKPPWESRRRLPTTRSFSNRM